MSLWTLLLCLLPTIVCAIGISQYECGEHGRFEYCIDGVPGCIVGCHCHPGYYFDTETKICEANAKLVQEYRRLYLPEPTRVQIPMTPAYLVETDQPTPTTINSLDNQVDAIAKDTDDLGDWLYNQFFKTIENQVINSTDKDKPLTRRSGIGSVIKKLRKNRKKPKKSKRIKIKNNDLRRKLLRITENDSLFDSNSESEETSDSSSSDSKSDTTGEDDNHNHHNDKEHGHRKFLVINKKPRPPLPSFIFLPNLETPFYPPIGLPPPPAIPMYPMVPVPPMPVCPYPSPTPDQQSNTETSKTTQRSPEKDPKNDKKDNDKNDDGKKDENIKDDKKDNDKKDGDKKDDDDKKYDAKQDNDDIPSPAAIRSQNIQQAQRKKLLRQLRQKMRMAPFTNPPLLVQSDKKEGTLASMRKLKNKQIPPPIPEAPFYDELTPQDSIRDDIKINQFEDVPPKDVDFKYLSQLIHKVDPNITQTDLRKNINGMHKQHPQRRTFDTRYYNKYDQPPEQFQVDQYVRGQYQPKKNQPVQSFDEHRFVTKPNEPDDSYYANLGQQIASLIRKIDSVGERQVNIEIEPTQITPPQPVFNENSYASRSYWERSVRSPLNFAPLKRELNYIQKNYENLQNLENKVETFATTEHALSLREIENVVFLMDRAKSKLQDKIKGLKDNRIDKKHSANIKTNSIQINDNLNINLLPRQSELANSKRRNFEYIKNPTLVNKVDTVQYNIIQAETTKTLSKSNITDELIRTNNLHYNLRGILMNNFRNAIPSLDLSRIKNETLAIRPSNSSLPIATAVSSRRTINNFEDKGYLSPNRVLDFIPNVKPIARPIMSRRIYQLTPMVNNLNNIRYYNNKKHSEFDKDNLPFEMESNSRFEKSGPSYFHHELHQFDYFD